MDPIEIYDRCLSGKPYSLELKIYSENYLKKVIKELEEIEEYDENETSQGTVIETLNR